MGSKLLRKIIRCLYKNMLLQIAVEIAYISVDRLLTPHEIDFCVELIMPWTKN